MRGSWPTRLVALVGSFTGSGNLPNHQAYALHNGSWGLADSTRKAVWDVPSSAALEGDSLWMFVPESFHRINGVLPSDKYPCSGVRRLPLDQVVIGPTAKHGVPAVDASFFPMDVLADGGGHAFIWGFSACRPGLQLGALGAERVVLETIPGTDACVDRDAGNGLPAMEARLFPASDGGLHAITYPLRNGDSAGKPACSQPRAYHRDAVGQWTSRSLQIRRQIAADAGEIGWPSDAGAVYVDPDGVVWVAISGPAVLRIAKTGETTEFGFAESCSRVHLQIDNEDETRELESDEPIDSIVTVSPGSVWLVVRYSGVMGLCRLR